MRRTVAFDQHLASNAPARGHLQHPQGRARHGRGKRLEIHNLVLGVEALDADLVFLQEVRLHQPRDAAPFHQTILGWPEQGQAEFLAPEGYNPPTAPTPSPSTASTATRCSRAGRWATSATTTCPTTASSSAACCTCR